MTEAGEANQLAFMRDGGGCSRDGMLIDA